MIAPWYNLTLGKGVSALDFFPACFPDGNGQVYLRGHISLSPVPAVGGSLLGLLPRDKEGLCNCTPELHDVIVTSTALAYVTNVPDVCIVRVKIAIILDFDVNMNRQIDADDYYAVMNSSFFAVDPSAASRCNGPCGRVDVNGDSKVNILDSLAIVNALNPSYQPVPCGGVMATAWSCGSTRKAPLTPAVSISLDSIVYFNDEGLNIASGLTPARKRSSLSGVEDRILQAVEELKEDNKELKAKSSQLEAKVDAKDKEHDLHFERLAGKTLSSSAQLMDVIALIGMALLSALCLVLWKRR